MEKLTYINIQVNSVLNKRPNKDTTYLLPTSNICVSTYDSTFPYKAVYLVIEIGFDTHDDT